MGQWHEPREKVVTENLSKVKTVDYWGERVPVAWETLPRGVCVWGGQGGRGGAVNLLALFLCPATV